MGKPVLCLLALAACSLVGGCAAGKPDLGEREMTVLEPYSTEIIYLAPDTEVNAPVASSDVPSVTFSAFMFGPLGALVAVTVDQERDTRYRDMQSSLAEHIKDVGDLHFNGKMLADTEAVISHSPWLGKAKFRAMTTKALQAMDVTDFVATASSDVVVVLQNRMEFQVDGSSFDDVMDMAIFTRDRHHRLTLYRRHRFDAEGDSPLKPVSTYQKETQEWTKLYPVSREDYMQAWCADGGANLKKAFVADEAEVTDDLRTYLGISGGGA